MKSVFLLPALLGLAFSHPAPEIEPRTGIQVAHFYFQAAATGYNLTVPADGNWHPTSMCYIPLPISPTSEVLSFSRHSS